MLMYPIHKPAMESRWEDINSFFIAVNATGLVSMEPTTAETLGKRHLVFFAYGLVLNFNITFMKDVGKDVSKSRIPKVLNTW